MLKILIESACGNGSISNTDRDIIYKKAQQLGISKEEVDKMINAELEKYKQNEELASGFMPIEEVEEEIKKIKENQQQNTANSKFTNVQALEYQGAMSLVYRAKLYGKWIIIKRIKPEYKDNPRYKELFYKEFENAYHLDHPNIVRLIDKGEDDEGPYYTMEYIDGRPLSQMITPTGLNNNRLSLKIAKQILDALSYVHKKQIFHRDLKPDNIFITYRGDNVKILDFGLATADAFDDNLKKAGTPRYASPEQLTNAADVDQRSDIYSFGKIFLEMLTGDVSDLAIEKVNDPKLKFIIEKATAKNKDDRFYDCEEILEIINNQNFVPPKKTSKTSTNIKKIKHKKENTKSKTGLIVGGAVFFIILLLGAWFLMKKGKIQEAKKENLVAVADSLYKKGKFVKALNIYKQINPQTAEISEKIAKIDSIISFVNNINTQLNSHNIARSLKMLENLAKKYPETSVYTKNKIDSCKKIIENADFNELQVVPESGTNKLGLADKNGNVVVDYQFDYIAPIKNWHKKGLIPVKINNKYGFVDRNKNYFAKCKYDPSPINNSFMWQPSGFDVTLNGKTVKIRIDENGNGYVIE